MSQTLNVPTVTEEANLVNLQSASHYHFTGMPTANLGAEKYTIVSIVCDTSGSIASFLPNIIKSLKTILASCQKSPQSENLLLRLVQFDDYVKELHGFRELSQIDPSEYDSILQLGGMTALNDAVFQSIEITRDYAKILVNQDFTVNAIIFVVTDGVNNRSKHDAGEIKKLIENVKRDECLESIQVVLIGITGGDQGIRNILQNFQQEVDITKYLNIDDATPSELAKLANWVSQSIISSSTALGSGGPSTLLTF